MDWKGKKWKSEEEWTGRLDDWMIGNVLFSHSSTLPYLHHSIIPLLHPSNMTFN